MVLKWLCKAPIETPLHSLLVTTAKDGVVPRTKLPEVLGRIRDLSIRSGLRIGNVFHAGDGNLHPLICYDGSVPGQAEHAEKVASEILHYCIEAGGAITGEHGVGFEKINQMCSQFAKDELVQFHALKAAFDPKGLLNPGKVIPTLNRCAEYGKMLVRGGQLKHPDLPRF